MSVVSIDVDLGKHVEGEPILGLHASLDLRVRTGLLTCKLVARERSDAESISFVFFVQRLKLMVVGVGQTSEASHVHHHHHFASVFVFQLGKLFIDIQSFEWID